MQAEWPPRAVGPWQHPPSQEPPRYHVDRARGDRHHSGYDLQRAGVPDRANPLGGLANTGQIALAADTMASRGYAHFAISGITSAARRSTCSSGVGPGIVRKATVTPSSCCSRSESSRRPGPAAASYGAVVVFSIVS
jgi:hypothetical protein